MTTPTALELRERLRTGEVSSRELVERSLAAAQAQESLGAFVSVEPELALAEADEAERLLRRTPPGERGSLPPLLGVPTAHKDLVAVRGFITTHGSAAVPHTRADSDDPVAATVRAAGAICIGKTQVPEFGIAGYSENLIAAPARNPRDPSLTAGGSSGGTAAALASGVLPAAIGSDAGGSIRIPSGACGLIGLKPGRGRVPADRAGAEPTSRNGSTPDTMVDEIGAPRMGVSGPMARTTLDAALYFDALVGDAAESALAAVRRCHELHGLRVGISFASPFESHLEIEFDDAARDAVARAARVLEAAGHRVEDADIDYGDEYPEAFTTVWTQALRRVPLDQDAEARLGELARWFLEGARRAGDARVAAAVQVLHRLSRDFARQWGRFDVVLTPALAFAPPEIGAFWARGPEGDYRLQCEWAPQTSVVNVVGNPAITVPILTDQGGLPRGVQLIGGMGQELQLLQLAGQLTGTAHPSSS